MAAYVKDTAELNREPRSLLAVQGSQPSVRLLPLLLLLVPTHNADSAERAENARLAEMAERTQACKIYRRGEMPSWVRNYSPRDDLTFIRNMTSSEQTAFAHEIPIPGLTAFIAASTDAALQEREQAEVRKREQRPYATMVRA
jgi:hypothetical protein